MRTMGNSHGSEPLSPTERRERRQSRGGISSNKNNKKKRRGSSSDESSDIDDGAQQGDLDDFLEDVRSRQPPFDVLPTDTVCFACVA